MKTQAIPRHLLFEFLCCWICMASFAAADADEKPLEGMKVVSHGINSKYVALKNNLIGELSKFTVCIDLNQTTNTSLWAAFTYKESGPKGADFGFGGVANHLVLYHFDNYSSFGNNYFAVNQWHSVCCTWNGSEINVYINRSVVFTKHYPSRTLKAPGTLVLGFNHTNEDGAIQIIHLTGFIGSFYYFQMWDYAKPPDTLGDCSEGNVISWREEFWDLSHVALSEDNTLRCANESIKSTPAPAATTGLQKTETALRTSPATHRTAPETNQSQPVGTTSKGVVTNNHTTDLTSSAKSTSRPQSPFPTQQIPETRTPSRLTTETQSRLTTETQPNGMTEPTSQTMLSISSRSTSTTSPSTTNKPNSILTTSASAHEKTSQPNHATSIETPTASAATRKVTFYRVHINMTVERKDGGVLYNETILYLTEILLAGIFKDPEFDLLQCALTQDGVSGLGNSRVIRNALNKLRPQSTGPDNSVRNYSPYGAKAILQANSADNQMEVMDHIETISQNQSYSDSKFKMQIVSVAVSPMALQSCKSENRTSRSKGTYSWRTTEPNSKDVISCVKNAEQNATRECIISIDQDVAKWALSNLRNCKLLQELPNTIIDLQDLIITPDDAEDIAKHILDLSLNNSIFVKEEIEVILKKTSEIIDIGDIDENFGHTILHIISDVLQKAESLRDFTNRILTMTEQLGDKITFKAPTVNMSTASLALAVTGVDLSLFQGVFFSITSYSQGMQPEILMHDLPLNRTVDFIYLPGSLQHHIQRMISRIQFNFFGTTSLFKDVTSKLKLNTYVAGASITNRRIQNLNDPVIVTLRHINKNTHHWPVHCAFWDFAKNNQTGGWSTLGCEIKSTNVNYTTCECNHLTHFGVLMDLSGGKIDPTNEWILTIITYLGCGISAIFLGVALVTYLAFVQLRKDNPSKILMNLCSALLMLNLTFLLNTWVSSYRNYSLCISMAVLLHYFLLVSFTWMGLEAVHMYFALVKVFNVYIPNYILKFCAVGWGVPAIMVITLVIVNRDFYGNGKADPRELSTSADDSVLFCWIENSLVFYISVVTYFSLIFLMNISMFIVVLHQINAMKSNQQKSMKTILHDLKSTASLTFLLGLTWGFAFFAWGPVRIAFLYMFAIANTLQGFFIFLFHCMMKENVRKQWRIHICCGRFRLDNWSDWSKFGTAGSKKNDQSQSQKSRSSQSLNYNSSNSVANGSSFTSDDTSSRTITKEWSRLGNAALTHNNIAWSQKSSPRSLKPRSSSSVSNGSSTISDDNSAKNLTNGGKYDSLCCVPPIKCVSKMSGTRRIQWRREMEMNCANDLSDTK